MHDVAASEEAGPAALRGGAMRAGGYALGLAFSLVAAPLLIRHLGIATFGRYSVVLTLVGLVGGVTEAGVNTLALREYAVHRGAERDVVMRQLLGIRFLVTGGGMVLALGFAVAAGYDSTLIAGTALCGAGVLLASVQSLLVTALQANLRFGWATVLDLVRQGLIAVGIVVLVVAGAGLTPFFAVPIVAAVVGLGLSVPLVRDLTPLLPSFDLGASRRLLRDTLPWAIATAVATAYFRIALIVMSLVSSDRVTGYYATSFRVVEVLIPVPGMIITAALPILARSAREDDARFAFASRRILELSVLGGTLMALGVLLGAPIAIEVLAGGAGRPSIDVLRLHGVALLPSFVAAAAGLQLLSLHREWTVVAGNVAGLVAAVVLTLVTVPALDATGGALATVIAELIVAGTLLVALVRERPALAALPRSSVPVIALGAVCATAAFLPVPATLQLAVGLAVFVAGLQLTGRFPPELREVLARR